MSKKLAAHEVTELEVDIRVIAAELRHNLFGVLAFLDLGKLFADAERFAGFEVAAVERHLILDINAPAGLIFFDILHIVADLAL